jgi:hypothetical protein
MNTPAYADVEELDASSASSIASTGRQMSISLDGAAPELATAFFVPGATYSTLQEMIGTFTRSCFITQS